MITPSYRAILAGTDPRKVPADLAAYARREFGDADAAWMMTRSVGTRARPRRARAPAPPGVFQRFARAVASMLL